MIWDTLIWVVTGIKLYNLSNDIGESHNLKDTETLKVTELKLPGSAPLIIDTAQMSISKMLKDKGYYTGIVGK